MIANYIRRRLAAWLGSANAVQEQQQSLVQLYWNRVELKKELAKAQDEIKAMRVQLQQQSEVRRAAEDQLLRLEGFLGDPVSGHHASVYFQLRLLWRAGKEALAQFSATLRRIQEGQEREQHATAIQVARNTALNEIEVGMAAAQQQIEEVNTQLTSGNEQLSQLRRFWHFRRRRELGAVIEQLMQQLYDANELLEKLKDDFDALNDGPLPTFAGISASGSRLVNTAVLAYAEWLIVTLPRFQLAIVMREALQKSLEHSRYGSKEDCAIINALVSDALSRLAQLNPASPEFAERIKALRGRAVYGSAIDMVPTEVSLGYLQLQDATADSGSLRVNVIADNYWDVGQFLLR